MIYSHEVEMMCPVAQGANHGPAPIPEEAKWVKAKEIKDISGFTHGVGWCAPQLTPNQTFKSDAELGYKRFTRRRISKHTHTM